MLGVLLESRAGRQRRSGGALASIVAHVAIISAAVVGTAAGTTAPRNVERPTVIVVTPPRPVKVVQAHSDPAPAAPRLPPNMVIRQVDAPTFTPDKLPPITVPQGAPVDSIVVGRWGRSGGGGETDGSAKPDGARGGASEWNVSDILMNVLTPAKPRYPESLRSAAIDGRVLVQFVVDTTGRVDMSSVKILSSTHDLFSRSVRDALSSFRFRPAESGGHRVAALAEMPFEFRITGR